MRARRVLPLLLVLCAAGAAQVRAEVRFGANGHPLTSYPGATYEQQIDSLADLGMTSYRVDIGSAADADKLEQLVAAAKARNVTILPVITPGLDLDNELPANLYRKSFELAATLVGRFKVDIRVWELGNELENYAIIKPCEQRDDGSQYDCAWGAAGGTSPLDYFDPRWKKVSAVLKGLSEGAASADPDIKRAMGTAGWGHVGAFARMQEDGIQWDISVWHMYGEDPEWAFKLLVNYERPIWVTEFNHPYGSRDGEEQQAKGLKDTIKRLRDLSERYNVEAAYIYELLDEPYWQDYEAVMGLVRVEGDGDGGWRLGRPKAAYATVQEALGGKPASPVVETREAADALAGPITERQCDLSPYLTLSTVDARNRVNYAYCLVLGRRPDPAGLQLWLRDLLGKGLTIETMLFGLLGSDELRQKAGSATTEPGPFVAAMYRLLLDRAVDGVGYDAYVTRLEKGSMSRVDVQRELIRSNEFKAKHAVLFETPAPPHEAFAPRPASEADAWRSCDLGKLERGGSAAENRVAYGYCLVLGREADSTGREHYARWLKAGKPLSSLLASLLESDEFQQKTAPSKLDDQKFVTLLYTLFLERQPDGYALENYTSRLASGALTRVQLGSEMISSEEFRRRQPFLFPEG